MDERYFPIFEGDKNVLDGRLAKTDMVQNEFGGFFNENGISHIDLLETFRRDRYKDRLYGLSDKNDHWDADGINITADIISKQILSKKG